MTDDKFDKILMEALLEAEMEELGPIWYGVPLGGGRPLPEKLERILLLAQQRQEEEESEPPED